MAKTKATSKVAANKVATITPAAQPAAPAAIDYTRKFKAGNTEYTLDFDLKYLAAAELACAAQGKFINLLYALDPSSINLHRLRGLFVGALFHFHPEIPYDAAVELLQPDNVFDFANLVWTVFPVKVAA